MALTEQKCEEIHMESLFHAMTCYDNGRSPLIRNSSPAESVLFQDSTFQTTLVLYLSTFSKNIQPYQMELSLS